MAAFSHVSGAAAQTYRLAQRSTFLSDPAGHASRFPADIPAPPMYTVGNTRYVSATAPGGGDGSIGNPWTRNEWNASQVSGRLIVLSGDFRNTSFTPTVDSQTFDFRLATFARGVSIAQASLTIIDGPNNVYAWTDAGGTTIDWTNTSCVVATREPASTPIAYLGVTKAQSYGAGEISITNVEAATDRIEIETPWFFAANEPMAFMAAAVGGLSPRTPYYARDLETINTDLSGATVNNRGKRVIRLSLSPGGAAVDVTAAINGSKLYCAHSSVAGAAVPNAATLNPGEFAYEPWNKRIVFRAFATLTAGAEATFYAGIGSGISIGNRSSIHVIGGTHWGAKRQIDIGSTGACSGCMVWGSEVLGCTDGVVNRGQSVNTTTRFVYAHHLRGAMTGEGAIFDPELAADHRYFVASYSGYWVHHWADRQAGMCNPGSDGTKFRDGLFSKVGVASFGSVTLPAKSLVPIVSTWGAATNDRSASVLMQRCFFDECYGENAKSYGGNDPTDGWWNFSTRVVSCVFDNRQAPLGSMAAKSYAAIFGGAAGSNTFAGTGSGNLFLLGDLTPFDEPVSGSRFTSAVSVYSANSTPVALDLVEGSAGNVFYSSFPNNGANSTLWLARNATDTDLNARPLIHTDYNKYCVPGATFLAVGVAQGAGTAWGSEGGIKWSTAMPTTPGAAPTWTSGPYTNDANSSVLSEQQMQDFSLNYSAWGEYVGPQATAAVARPGWARGKRM